MQAVSVTVAASAGSEVSAARAKSSFQPRTFQEIAGTLALARAQVAKPAEMSLGMKRASMAPKIAPAPLRICQWRPRFAVGSG